MSARLASIAALVGGVALVTVPLAVLATPSCETYAPPPTATLVGLSSGILKDPLAPLVVQFSTPVDPASVSLVVAPFTIDAYGNLPDETDGGHLDVLMSHDSKGDVHTSAALSADGTTLTLAPSPVGWLPTGPSLVLLVNPGLRSKTTGTVLHYRQRIPFSYPASCGKAGATAFRSGAYFFLLYVTQPLPITLKAFAAIDVNPLTGEFYGQFTAAIRNSDPGRCSPPCTGGEVCQLLPHQQCVVMSSPPVNVLEYPDYVDKATAPNGYTFEMHGCASDVGDGGAVNVLTSPGVLDVPEPAVSIQGLTLTAEFVPADGGVVVGSGSLTASKAFLGTTLLAGTGAGTLQAISIPDGGAPKDLPQPGMGTNAPDGGLDASAEGVPG